MTLELKVEVGLNSISWYLHSFTLVLDDAVVLILFVNVAVLALVQFLA